MIRYQIHPQQGLLVAVWSGEVADADLVPTYSRIYADPAWRPGLHELVDLRGANVDGITGDGLRALAALVSRCVGDAEQRFRTAVIVSQDIGFGLARMYGAYSAESPEEVQVFRDPQSALRWLGAAADLLDTFDGEPT